MHKKSKRLPTTEEFFQFLPKRLEFEWSKNKEGIVTIKVPKFTSKLGISFCKTIKKDNAFSANLDKASKHNESNRIALDTPDSRRVVVIQIAGLIARRIACWIKDGDRVDAGQRFGLIRFGSRLEVCLPEDTKITVELNQKVKAGESIIGYLS